MNITMQRPLRYPFYMDASRLPMSMPWSSVPFLFPTQPQHRFRPSYLMARPSPAFIYPQQNNLIVKPAPPSSPYTNTRYRHLKKSTSHPNRGALHRSFDVPTRSHNHHHHHKDPLHAHHHRSSRTKSISDLEPTPEFTSAPLSKAHSWHAMMNHRRTNLSVAYAQEMNGSPKRRRKRSFQKKKRISPQRRLSSSSPKRKASFKYPRKRSVPMPERGIVRISTLDEMPVPKKQTQSINNDRLSTKGSISNSSTTRRMKAKGSPSINSRKVPISNHEDVENHTDTSTDSQSSSSSTRSRTSLQQRMNGSLRNDPLISAAMDDLQQFRRSSSQNLSLIPSSGDRSRDSLRSDSTFRSSPSSSSSHSHSQSSFTSLERSEIRHLIKTIKTKDTKSLNAPLQSSPTSPSEDSIRLKSPPSAPIIKPKKSCVTEELDRKFNKLRALDPDQEISYVTPSSICKRKKLIKESAPILPPLPTFDELLRQVQLRPVDRSVKPIPPVKETKPVEEMYENPLSPVPVPRCSPVPPVAVPRCSLVPPVAVPRCSPVPPPIEIKAEEMRHEYALPIKRTEEKSLPQISHFQPSRNYHFAKPITTTLPEKRPSRPISMFNWFNNNPANPMLTTFQPNRITNPPHDHGITSVKENIYTSDIDVYVPISTIEKTEDDSLQIHLDNQTIMTDDFYSDYQTKQATNSSSILDDFSHLLPRKHRHQHTFHKKNQRCSIM